MSISWARVFPEGLEAEPSPKLVQYFGQCTETIFQEYKDLVKYWLAFNEINCSILIFDFIPNMPPERKQDTIRLLHNQFLASARAVNRVCAVDPGYQVGCMLAGYPLTCDSAGIRAAQVKMQRGLYYSSACVTTHEDAEMDRAGNLILGDKNPCLSYSNWGWSIAPLRPALAAE